MSFYLVQITRLRLRQVAGLGELRQVHAIICRRHHSGQSRARGLRLHSFQHLQPFRSGAAAMGRERIDHHAARQGPLGRLIAQNETIAKQGADGGVQNQLSQGSLARLDTALSQHGDPAGDVGGSEMQMHRRPVRQWPGFAIQNPYPGIKLTNRCVDLFSQQPIAPADQGLVQITPGDIDGATLPYAAHIRRPVEGPQTAYPRFNTF